MNEILAEGNEGTSPKQGNFKHNIDRAKPRKSPHRPLPGIVTAILARSSSGSDVSETQMSVGSYIVGEDTEISFENLQEFCDTVPQGVKDKKRSKNNKKSGKKQQKKHDERGMKNSLFRE
jgi:hypothetical protein